MNTGNYIQLYRIYVILSVLSNESVSPYENAYMKISVTKLLFVKSIRSDSVFS